MLAAYLKISLNRGSVLISGVRAEMVKDIPQLLAHHAGREGCCEWTSRGLLWIKGFLSQRPS